MPKERRKGQKEIYRDNLSTLDFYFKISVIANIIHVGHILFYSWWYSEIQAWSIFWLIFSFLHHGGGNWMLRYLSRAVLGPKDEVIDAGSDLADSWISEYSKDVILYISILQCTSIISNMIWSLWIVIPVYAFYKIWITLLWPWFQAGSQPLDEGGSKKGKKSKTKRIH